MPESSLPLISRLVANRPRDLWVVELSEDVVVPEGCANCGELASRAHPESRAHRRVLVPYCARCSSDLAKVGTTQLAALLAAVLLEVTLLLTLPWIFRTLGLGAFLTLVATGGALPLAVAWGCRRPAAPPQTSSGKAAFWIGDGVFGCFNEAWARALGRTVGSEPAHQRHREPVLSLWMAGVVGIGLAAAPSVYTFSYPDLMVLNFAPTRVSVLAEGTLVAEVEPTSLESSRAGARVRLAAGEHRITVVGEDGAQLEERPIRLVGGGLHLLSISGAEYCFWLERDDYGKGASGDRTYQPLDPQTRFWVVPTRVDSWFSPNPGRAEDGRSSGGSMTALRHARCDEAPEMARSGPAAERPR
jgi:hypothetical protein